MSAERRAVIDIGTNSVKLLVGDVTGPRVDPVFETGIQTRLGRGLYESGRLGSESIRATLAAVRRLLELAASHGASSIHLLATSAVREAANGPQLVADIETMAGHPVQVISGETEAALAFQGVQTDARLNRCPQLILEVGGGSTQWILRRTADEQTHGSLALGAVRLFEALRPGDPPSETDRRRCEAWLEECLRTCLEPILAPALTGGAVRGVDLVGTGGTSSVLAMIQLETDVFDRERIESTPLPQVAVRQIHERLWALPIEARRRLAGIPADRADIVLTGVAIYESVMRVFGFGQMHCSTRGVRFGALLVDPRNDFDRGEKD